MKHENNATGTVAISIADPLEPLAPLGLLALLDPAKHLDPLILLTLLVLLAHVPLLTCVLLCIFLRALIFLNQKSQEWQAGRSNPCIILAWGERPET